MILERSDSPEMDTMLTVRSKRGEEFVVNADKLASAFVDLISDIENEQRFGWELRAPWFEEELRRVLHAALTRSTP
jgi:hypothetical protein